MTVLLNCAAVGWLSVALAQPRSAPGSGSGSAEGAVAAFGLMGLSGPEGLHHQRRGPDVRFRR